MEVSEKQFRKRNAIYACLSRTKEHPSAEMLYEMLREEYPDISLATIYRNLAWFRSHGLVQSLGPVNGMERFDACIRPHAHFICTHCSAVIDLPEIQLPMEPARRAEEEMGIRIDTCQLTYAGLCESCKHIQSVENPQ